MSTSSIQPLSWAEINTFGWAQARCSPLSPLLSPRQILDGSRFYGYGFSDDLSTCIVERCPEVRGRGLGIDSLREGEGLALLGKIFERELDGHPLMNMSSGNEGASWLNFRTVTNQKWHHDNIVLMGDAAHTTHYSLGGGTTLALEDAIGLAGELRRCKDVQAGA